MKNRIAFIFILGISFTPAVLAHTGEQVKPTSMSGVRCMEHYNAKNIEKVPAAKKDGKSAAQAAK